MQREIEKFPALPDRFVSAKAEIEALCFLTPRLEPVPAVFVFGNWRASEWTAKQIEYLFYRGISRHFILSGGTPTLDINADYHVTVPERLKQFLPEEIYPYCIHVDRPMARNSLAEMEECRDLLLPFAKGVLGFVARDDAIGRQCLTLQKALPETQLLPMPYKAPYTTDMTGNADWFETEQGQQRVWGEVLRIKKYGSRGDIAYPDAIKDQIIVIEEKIGFSIPV